MSSRPPSRRCPLGTRRGVVHLPGRRPSGDRKRSTEGVDPPNPNPISTTVRLGTVRATPSGRAHRAGSDPGSGGRRHDRRANHRKSGKPSKRIKPEAQEPIPNSVAMKLVPNHANWRGRHELLRTLDPSSLARSRAPPNPVRRKAQSEI